MSAGSCSRPRIYAVVQLNAKRILAAPHPEQNARTSPVHEDEDGS